MGKITYEDKVPAVGPPEDWTEEMKVSSGDMNQIKESVNGLYDAIGATYKMFKGWFTQEGTGNPDVENVINTFGFEPSIARTGMGTIGILFPDSINPDKLEVIVGNKTYSAKHILSYYYLTNSDKTVTIKTYNLANEEYADDMLISTPIEIRVYD